MSLLREWASRAHEKGFNGSLVRQILADGEFEKNALDGLVHAAARLKEATTSDFPDLVGDSSNVQRDLIKGCERGLIFMPPTLGNFYHASKHPSDLCCGRDI